jgi:hypothetical protein
MASLLYMANSITRGDMVYHEPNTANVFPVIPNGFDVQSVYEAFIHYCRFDSDIPISPDILPICNDKPKDYDRRWSIEEKMDFLKRNGRNYSVDHLHQMMQVINRRNLMPEVYQREFSAINRFKDILEHLELKKSVVIEAPVREKMWEVLKHHNANVMVSAGSENDLNDALRVLQNTLARSINRMLDEITQFIDDYAEVSNTEYRKLETFLREITKWNLDDASKTDTREYTLYTIHQYVKNEIIFMAKTAPSIMTNGGNFTTIPKHWDLSLLHKGDISRFVEANNSRLNVFKNNPLLSPILEKIKPVLQEVVEFMENIPIFSPIHKSGTTFYSLFSVEAVHLLNQYCWYSVFYEYIMAAKRPDTAPMETRVTQRQPLTGIQEQLLEEVFGEGSGVYGLDLAPGLQEIEIVAGDRTELFRHVAKLLVVYLNMGQTNKKMIDIPYAKLELGVGVTQSTEKKKITDFFGNMENEERRIQYQMKQLKLGDIWSEGLRKSIFEYDADVYDKAREQTEQYFVADLNQFGIEINGIQNIRAQAGAEGGMTAEELAEYERRQAEEQYNAEANDIGQLHGGFMDGVVYSEDEDEDNDENWEN